MTGNRQNFARTMIRKRPDFRRIGESMKQPGIDPRSWFSFARVDEGEDARVWDTELGWLVDVTFRGGPLDGEGPVLCRVAGTVGPEFGAFIPPREDALVVVAVPGGDPNNDCIILGEINDTETVPPPEVNGSTIDEAFASQTQIFVFPDFDLDATYRNFRLINSGNSVFAGESVALGIEDADQPFARGTDLADALDDFASAVQDAATQLAAAAPAPPNAALLAADSALFANALVQASVALLQAREGYLSTRIVGD